MLHLETLMAVPTGGSIRSDSRFPDDPLPRFDAFRPELRTGLCRGWRPDPL